MRTPALAAIAVLLLARPVSAAAGADGIGGFVATGPWLAPDYEGSADHAVGPLALGRLRYREFYLQVQGAVVRANLLPAGIVPLGGGLALHAGPSASYRFARDDVDNPRINRLRDVDAAIELGGFASLEAGAILHDHDMAFVRIEAHHDVTGVHDGLLVSLAASYVSALARWMYAGLEATAIHADGAYADTYFTIDADNAARSGLARFDAGAGFKSARADLSLGFIVTDAWHVMLIGRYARLFGDAAASPIVAGEGDAEQLSGGLAIAWHF